MSFSLLGGHYFTLIIFIRLLLEIIKSNKFNYFISLPVFFDIVTMTDDSKNRKL